MKNLAIRDWEEVASGMLVATPCSGNISSHRFSLRIGDEEYAIGILRRNGTLEVTRPAEANHYPWRYSSQWGKRVFVVARRMSLASSSEQLRSAILDADLPRSSTRTDLRAHFVGDLEE